MHVINFSPFSFPILLSPSPAATFIISTPPSTFKCYCMNVGGNLLEWDNVSVTTPQKKMTLTPQQPYSNNQETLF